MLRLQRQAIALGMVVVVLNAAGPVIFAVTGSGRPVNYWIALASEVALGLILLTYRVNRQSTKWRLLGVAIVIAGFAMVAAITNLVVTLTSPFVTLRLTTTAVSPLGYHGDTAVIRPGGSDSARTDKIRRSAECDSCATYLVDCRSGNGPGGGIWRTPARPLRGLRASSGSVGRTQGGGSRMTEVQTDLTPLILLARVSSETQAEKNSVERQLVQLHQWAPRHNYRVIAECIDDGVSGEILNRPGVNEAKRLIEAGEARHVAIWEHDRLGRAELVEMLILRRELMQLGATVIEATTGQVLTADDEMGELIYALNSWKGAAEKKRIVQRTNQQKRINLTKPEPTYFGGIVAYGYDVTRDKTYFIVDSEAEIVRSIFAWHLAGETPTAIANKLNAMGVPARGQGNRSNGRDDWTAQRIKDTIRNPIYKGEGRYGRKSGGKAGKPWRRNPANLHATYRLPAIVEEEAWASANEVVDRRRPRRQPNNEYALSGLIVCGMCGWSYSGGGGGYSSKTSKVRTTYYRCNSKSGYSGRHACNNKPVRVEQLERWAWDAIDSLLFTPANVEAWLDREYGGGTDHTSRLADVQKRIRQLKEEGRRLAQDLNGREGLARDLLLEQIDNLDTHLKALTSEENAIRESQESSTRRQAAAKNVQETLAKLRERFGGFHREDRAQIFRQLVDKVEILPPGQTTRAVLYLRPGLGGQTVVGLPFA